MHLQHFCSLSCAVQTRVLCFRRVAWIVKWSRCSTTQAVIFLILREKLQSVMKDNSLTANVFMQWKDLPCVIN